MTLVNLLLAAGSFPLAILGAPLVDSTHILYDKVVKRATADVYRYYAGTGQTGTSASNWPAQSRWVSNYDDLFSANLGVLRSSCSQWGVPNNSDAEIQNIRDAVRIVSSEAAVDPRFVFAVVMQESNGCVRAPTTNYGVRNPGLMQDHNGAATCNENGRVSNPCPAATITQMIRDGVQGTPSGDGLVQLLSRAGASDASGYYKAARMYNSGSIASNGELTVGATATACYASDVANRLTGWVFARSGCSSGNNVLGASNAPFADADLVAAMPSPSPSPAAASKPSSSPPVAVAPLFTAGSSSNTFLNPNRPMPSPSSSSSSTSTSSTAKSSPTFPSDTNATSRTPAGATSYGLGPGAKAGCSRYYIVQDGDWCAKIAESNGISFAQLRGLNPGLDGACSNLWRGYEYCVAA